MTAGKFVLGMLRVVAIVVPVAKKTTAAYPFTATH
jgi:hypothetical protein